MPRHDDDRERRSWRDIDRKKDQSSHIDRTDPYKKGKPGARTEGRSKSYRSALDKFFDGGALPERYQKLSKTKEALAKTSGPGSDRQAALRQMREAVGRVDIVAAVKEYAAIDPALPRDAEALLAVLQHPDEEWVRDAMTILLEMADERPLPRKSLFRQRLRRIEDLAEESDTAELASELRRKIG